MVQVDSRFSEEIKIWFFFFRLMSGSVAIDSLDIYWWDCIMTPKYVFLRMVPFKEKIRKQIIRNADVMKRVWRTEDEMQWEEWPRPGFNQLMVIKWCCNMAGPLPNVTNTFRMIFMDLYMHLDHNKSPSISCQEKEPFGQFSVPSLWTMTAATCTDFFCSLGISFRICFIEVKKIQFRCMISHELKTNSCLALKSWIEIWVQLCTEGTFPKWWKTCAHI